MPASILMWLDYNDGASSYGDQWQTQIWDYAAARGWAAHGLGGTFPGGVNPEYIDDLAAVYLNHGVSRYLYQIGDAQRAVADQEKSIDNNNPVLVVANYGVHMVVMIGASFNEVAGARPATDYVVIHDPQVGYPGFQQYTLNFWMTSKGTSCSGSCIEQHLKSSFPFRFADQEYAEFEAGAGTYFGEPNPPALASGENLYPGQFVDSRDGRFRLTYQYDGNLVLYGPSGPLWATNCWPECVDLGPPGVTRMQQDGNLVVYNGYDVPVWASHTDGSYNAFLTIHDNGNAVIYTTPFSAIWQTNTGGW